MADTNKPNRRPSQVDKLADIRYTAAVAKCRGTYKYISDIADDVPVVTDVDYWRAMPMPRVFKPLKNNSTDLSTSPTLRLNNGSAQNSE